MPKTITLAGTPTGLDERDSLIAALKQANAERGELMELYLEQARRAETNLARICFVAVSHGVITRMLCAQMVGVDLCDLDDWVTRYAQTSGA
jgi:broad specificity phosphatase PhoE